tara:strand:- start:170 stop:343 length:174 start_codon:yes stop_codon:yes gene_type:complete
LIKRANRLQQSKGKNDEIDQLLHFLDLGFADPRSIFTPQREDISEWFMGAPKWLERC